MQIQKEKDAAKFQMLFQNNPKIIIFENLIHYIIKEKIYEKNSKLTRESEDEFTYAEPNYTCCGCQPNFYPLIYLQITKENNIF